MEWCQQIRQIDQLYFTPQNKNAVTWGISACLVYGIYRRLSILFYKLAFLTYTCGTSANYLFVLFAATCL